MLKKFVHIKDLYPVKFVDITGKIYNIDDYKDILIMINFLNKDKLS